MANGPGRTSRTGPLKPDRVSVTPTPLRQGCYGCRYFKQTATSPSACNVLDRFIESGKHVRTSASVDCWLLVCTYTSSRKREKGFPVRLHSNQLTTQLHRRHSIGLEEKTYWQGLAIPSCPTVDRKAKSLHSRDRRQSNPITLGNVRAYSRFPVRPRYSMTLFGLPHS